MPHLIVAALFASHMWTQPIWAIPAMLAIVAVTLLAWWNGRPSWLYPWIGYSLVLLLICGWVSRTVLGQPCLFVLDRGPAPNFPLSSSCWRSCCVAVGGRRDDCPRCLARLDLASLMLAPLPLFGGWLASIDEMNGFFRGPSLTLHRLDGEMGLALLALAVTSASFVLVRQRVLKFGGLAVVGTLAAATVGHNLWGEQGLFGLLAASFLLLLFFLSPALLKSLFSEAEPSPWDRNLSS